MTASATRPDALRIAGILEESCVDGPGLRMAIFAQGCPHHCPGCHNPETHAFEGGRLIDIKEIVESYLQNPLLDGITCSGGEPFCQPKPFASLARMIHNLGGTVVTYTGYMWEELKSGPMSRLPGVSDLLAESDFLVDGPFIQALASLELTFRGSSNQRFLDLRKM